MMMMMRVRESGFQPRVILFVFVFLLVHPKPPPHLFVRAWYPYAKKCEHNNNNPPHLSFWQGNKMFFLHTKDNF